MARAFFKSKEHQEVLLKEIKEWRGTPFRHRAAVKKVGTDCVHFCMKVYENVGAVKDVVSKIPYYGHDWCFHTWEERFYKGLKARRDFVEVKNWNNIMNGDLVLYRFGKASSHCAIYFDGNIHQSVNLSGVHHVLFQDSMWYRRRRFLFRVIYV